MNPAALIYLGMGILIAKILLEGTDTKSYRWLQWLQLVVHGASIVLLWPLMLFAEKVTEWFQISVHADEKADKSLDNIPDIATTDTTDSLNFQGQASYTDPPVISSVISD
jgi:hypothetical protein